MNPKKENIIKCLTFLDLGYKFLILTENALNELIQSGNKHVILSDKPIGDDYFNKVRWSDFQIAIPVFFNFYHALELIMKGLLSLKGNVKNNHNLSLSLQGIKEIKEFPADIILILDKYIYEDQLNTLLKSFLKINDIGVNEFYEYLRYPYNKAFTKTISYSELKYKGAKALPYYKEIVQDSIGLRTCVGRYYAEFRD